MFFAKLSEREKKLAAATLVALVIGGGAIGYRLISDAMMRAPVLEITAIHFQDLMEKLDSVEDQKEQNHVYRRQINNEQGTFPEKDEVSQLYAELSQVGQKSHIKIGSMDPTFNLRAQPLATVEIRINAECRFENLIQFLDNLRSAQYLMQPKTMKLSLKDKNRPDLQVQMTLVTYLLDTPGSAAPPNTLVRSGS